ncbi:helix-turn-helix transcriptional regulator [Planomonospora sp. ID91781]|uniref:helix-turn-helix domain-containing protein n=1 Tax=Planomonospora sp. ID91781 TaxID=2738135 RepID=UPI0018C3A438|nr:helix-turn-helix transcriptional regulator [Planomonospora sp. ID91781]MBG0825889.1 helix-turn-helix transcriptional regulator [Planomonospora sp. ID91781]
MIGDSTAGWRLRTLRKQAGMTWSQLAGPEFTEDDIAAYEAGEETMSPLVLGILAERLGCSPVHLQHGVADQDMAVLRSRADRADKALRDGRLEVAVQEFTRLRSEPGLPLVPQLRWQVEYGYALALEATGDRRAAIDRLTTLLEQVGSEQVEMADQEIRHREQRISIAVALCRCHREVGDLGAAVRVGEAALEREEPLGWTDRLVELGATLLAAYMERGQYARMAQFNEQLLEVADWIGSTRAQLAAAWNGAAVAMVLGDRDNAELLSKRALRLQEERGGRLASGRLRMFLAEHMLLHMPDDLDRIEEMLAAAHADLIAAPAHPGDVASCELALARVDLVRGRAVQARERAQQIVRHKDLVGPVAVEAHELLAAIDQTTGDLPGAAAAQARAAEILQAMVALPRASRAWRAAADLHGQVGAADQEHRALVQALQCAHM